MFIRVFNLRFMASLTWSDLLASDYTECMCTFSFPLLGSLPPHHSLSPIYPLPSLLSPPSLPPSIPSTANLITSLYRAMPHIVTAIAPVKLLMARSLRMPLDLLTQFGWYVCQHQKKTEAGPRYQGTVGRQVWHHIDYVRQWPSCTARVTHE